MLKLASIEILLVTFAIFGNEIIWNCYKNYQECVAENNKTDYSNVENVGSNNLIEFCFDYTQNILPCLATKLNLTKGMSVSIFSLLLANCDAQTEDNKSAMIEVQQNLKHLARFYAYFCAYSNILDLHRNTECFGSLMKHCVLNKPDMSCMFYYCAKVSLNLSKSHLTTTQQCRTQQYQTRKTINLTSHQNRLSIPVNHQDRITPVACAILVAFIMQYNNYA